MIKTKGKQHSFKRTMLRLVIIFSITLSGSLTFSQEKISPEVLKSAILNKILNKITWKNQDKIKKFKMAFVGDESILLNALKDSSKYVKINGKPFNVERKESSFKNLKDYHIVFVAQSRQDKVASVARLTRRTNTLLVTDQSLDKQSFMINFVKSRKGRSFKFEVNKSNIIFEYLKVSKDIYLLGGTELDVAEVYKETETMLDKVKIKLMRMENDFKKESSMYEEKLRIAEKKLADDEEKINKAELMIAEGRKKLDEINKKSLSLNKIINENKKIIKLQNIKISQQSKKTEKQIKTIDKQRQMLTLSLTAVGLFIVMISIIFRSYRAKTIAEKKLNELLKELEKVSEYKTKFLANMSHEIRTPMNSIIGFSQMLSRDKSLSFEQNSKVKSINSSGEHLLKIINNILEISKIESGEIEFERKDFNLFNLLSDVESMFFVKKEQKNIDLVFSVDSSCHQFVKGDDAKIRQILINLVGNSLKFTKEGSVKVFTSSETLENHKIKITFKVEDSGVGISESDLKELFQQFKRAKEGDKSVEGTGLGLAISRNYAELLGGGISVSSEVGKGSVFEFTCVLDVGDEEQAKLLEGNLEVIGIVDDKKYKVLIVDDNDLNREVLTSILCPVGFEVKEASNSVDGFNIVEKWRPDIILIDYMMPEMKGDAAIKVIRSLPCGETAKIVIVTAAVFEIEKSNLKDLRADGLIYKPVNIDQIFKELSSSCNIQFIYESNLEEKDKPSKKVDVDLFDEDAIFSINKAIDLGDVQNLEKIFLSIEDKNRELSKHLLNKVEDFDFKYLKVIFDKTNRGDSF